MICVLLISLVAATISSALALPYPEAKKGDVVEDYHGTKVADPYRWLEDLDSPQTAAWIKAQNEVTAGYLSTLPDRRYFREQLKKFWNFERYTPPIWEGGRYIFRRNNGLQNQSLIYTVRQLQDTPTLVLDPNQLSADGTIAVTALELSHDGNLLAYSIAASGSDWTEIHVRDLSTNKDRPDVIKWVKFSEPAWTHDNRGFFYARFPEPVPGQDQTFAALQNQKLYYHRLGDPQEKDTLIYERPGQPKEFFSGYVTEDGRYLLVSIEADTGEKNLLYYKDLKQPDQPELNGPMVALVEKYENSYRPIEVVDNQLYVRTDKDAPRYRVLRRDLTQSDYPWTEVVPQTKDLLESADVIGGKFVLNYLIDAKSELRVAGLNGKAERTIALPTLGAVSAVSGNVSRPDMFYAFTSFLYPPTIFRYDVDSASNEIFRQPQLDFSPDAFETKQIFFHSKDGTLIPMFVVKARGTNLDGKNPVYLTGYGGFNVSIEPQFSVPALCWIKKGGVFAVPNLRGGGEYGRTWHEAGTKEHKQNVFDDFRGAAKTLIKEKYTEPGRLGIVGASNGGLLVGATLTQHPELLGAAVAEVGVLDMLRYHKFTIGWAWASDYGTSDDPEAFKYLIRYSPLQNVKPGTCYPPTLITTADHDDRVFPAHSFKFAAALQAAQSCPNPIIIRIETKAGHGGGKPLSKIIDEETDVLAFLWKNLAEPAE